jgi:polar amino acid transport system substrate-binding protein
MARLCAAALTVVALLQAAPAQSATIRLTTVSWEPYYGREMRGGGPVTALVRAAARVKGHTIEVTFQPWQRALTEARRGTHDGVLGAYHNAERAEHFHFTESFLSVPVSLIGRRGEVPASYDGLRELAPYVIGYNRGWEYPDHFDRADFLVKEAATDHRLNVRKLLLKRVDLVAMAEGIFHHTVAEMNGAAASYVALDPPLMTGRLHVTISNAAPNAERLTADLNAGLARIRADGTYDAILGQYAIGARDRTP